MVVLVSGCKKKPASANASPIIEQTNPESIVTVELARTRSIKAPVMQENEYTAYVAPKRSPQEIDVICSFSEEAPVIDGVADDALWETVAPVTTLDFTSQRPIELRSVHTNDMIYFLVQYSDAAPSETHKSWIWDKQEQVYKPGSDREDMFILKWKMSGDSISFSPDLVEPHTADIWFWKARRTNPNGYLDDKRQEMTTEQAEGTTPVKSDKYGTLYLLRKGDAGKSAYEEQMFFEYHGDFILKYYLREPEGSRADIRGKGCWADGQWTIEIGRKLNTGHEDDIALSIGQSYVFGASLYEMAGIPEVSDKWFQPLYKTGNVFDALTLIIQ